ncbi:MAG: hypothetical protein NTW21_08340 [Verrucomicrobia bacterium]|nr:hypothetical protein [Verrucomicrobiota bacterium]
MALLLAFEITLLGGDAFLAAEQAVAAEVLVAPLDETKPRLVPDEPVVLGVPFANNLQNSAFDLNRAELSSKLDSR